MPAIPTVGQGDIVTRHDGTRVGVWMMPDHKNPGELEDLLLKFVPAEDATWRVAQRAACVARALGASIKPGDLRKVELRTWLPWCDDPGATFQTAIMSGRLDAGVGGAGFVDWYVRVFGP